MTITARERLHRLGRGDRIADVSAAAGMSREQFDSWWREECRRRVPTGQPPRPGVRVQRDQWGVPTVHAPNNAHLFVGGGYAAAQARLSQLDYPRRKAQGRLAEVLGPE